MIYRHWQKLILLLLALLPAIGSPGRDVSGLFEAALLAEVPDQLLTYKSVDGNDLSLALFEPNPDAPAKQAAIIWVHGGGWEGGNPGQFFPHAAYFAELGYTSLSVEYRLATRGNTVFDAVDDVRDAFYWVWENADSLGISQDRIIIGGESAGGHLAACVGYIDDARESGIPSPQPFPRACVLVNPIVDLPSLPWALTKPGLSPEDIPLAESISPLFHVDAADPPALLLHGDSDSVVPASQSTDMAANLHALDIAANLRLWEGKDHAFFLYLPEFSLNDKPVIHLSLLEIEAFLQAEQLNAYPSIHGHFSPVRMFAGNDGFRSFSELIAHEGQLYGTTYKGGPDDAGTVFRFDPLTREHTVLHFFDGTDGREAFNGLAVTGSTLYGVTKFGGSAGDGTLFRIETDGTGFTVLHAFDQASGDGYYPHAAPVLVDGALYGTAYHGGSSTFGGVLYKYSLPAGPYSVLHSFTSATGRHPTGQLVRLGDWLYGTASDLFQHAGGYYGSLYRVHATNGTFERLHTFDGSEGGGHPYDDLIPVDASTLVGTTFGQAGNPDSKGAIFSYSISNDTLSILHDFGASPGTGSKPNGSLLAIDGSGYLYGHAHGSNAEGGESGSLFRIKTDGTRFQLLHRFAAGLDGNTPMRGLAYIDGALFGVTAFGGLTSDIGKPESGPGFIYRYQPVATPGTARSAYVDWLGGHGLLINQPTSGNPDNDSLGLLEEFTFGGSPSLHDDPVRITLRPETGGFFKLQLDTVRAVMRDALVPLHSEDLADWSEDASYLLEALTHPSESPEFEQLIYSWETTTRFNPAGFIRLRLEL